MKKILAILFLMFLAVGIMANTATITPTNTPTSTPTPYGDGSAFIVPSSGATGAWVSAITVTVKDFNTAFGTGAKLIVSFPATMPTPNITPGTGNVTITCQSILPSAYALNGQNITVTLKPGASDYTKINFAYYGGVTLPAAGSYTWAVRVAVNGTATPAPIYVTKNKAIFVVAALTSTPTITPTYTPTSTPTTSADAPKTITSGVVISTKPCYVNELYVSAMGNTYTGLKLINAASLITTTANTVMTINYPKGSAWDYFVPFNACIPKSGIYFDKGLVLCTADVSGSPSNNTITATVLLNKAEGTR